MTNIKRGLAVLAVLLAWVVTDASAQYTIQRREKQEGQQHTEHKHNPYEAFGGFVEDVRQKRIVVSVVSFLLLNVSVIFHAFLFC